MDTRETYGAVRIQTNEVEPRQWMPEGSQSKSLNRRLDGADGLETKQRWTEILGTAFNRSGQKSVEPAKHRTTLLSDAVSDSRNATVLCYVILSVPLPTWQCSVV